MDSWQVAQNYLVAAAIGGAVGGYYYYTANRKKPNRTGSLNAITPRRSETDLRGRNMRLLNTQDQLEGRSANVTPDSRQASSSAARRRKTGADSQQVKQKPSLDVIADERLAKDSDMSAAQFASRMQQARQGTNLQTPKSKDARVKTVKARASVNAFATPLNNNSGTSAEQEEEREQEIGYSTTAAGGVSDMLEPTAPPPSTIRITAPTEPSKATPTFRPAREDAVETKKQRQNRKKAEERKALREEEEAARKMLEERQRRTAREARGEPAKNGVQARVPVRNPWEQGNAEHASNAGGPQSAMLDTFDAESTGSSNGGPGASTAATSTTSGDQPRWELSSEEEQIAAALKQSGDESGWTTVSAVPQKSKGLLKTSKEERGTRSVERGSVTSYTAASQRDSEVSSSAALPATQQQTNGTANSHARSGDEAGWTTVSVPTKMSKGKAQQQVNKTTNGHARSGAYAALDSADWKA